MPDCGGKHKLFGNSHIEEIAKEHNLEVLGKLPIDPKIAEAVDLGNIENFQGDWLNKTADHLEII